MVTRQAVSTGSACKTIQEACLGVRHSPQEGIVWWAGNAQMRNELGNVQLQLGSLSGARESYEVSQLSPAAVPPDLYASGTLGKSLR